MTIFGVDAHPRYQEGLDVERIRAEGFEFLAVKLSEGTVTVPYAGSFEWIGRAKAVGLCVLGYHYLTPGNEARQAEVFAAQLQRGGVPGMMDAEALTRSGIAPAVVGEHFVDAQLLDRALRHDVHAMALQPSLTMAGIQRFADECAARQAPVPFAYLPRWYWTLLEWPDLRPLRMQGWGSRYTDGSDYASRLYQRHHPSGWDPYGGMDVAVLQFSDQGMVAGKQVDVNAFRGTRRQFEQICGLTPPAALTSEERSVFQQTEPGEGTKDTWPTVRFSVGVAPDAADVRLHFSAPGGWVHEAKWWVANQGAGKPHDPVTVNGQQVGAEQYVGLGRVLIPPPKADELELVLSAPGGVHIF